jgi:hypothetical protein
MKDILFEEYKVQLGTGLLYKIEITSLKSSSTGFPETWQIGLCFFVKSYNGNVF